VYIFIPAMCIIHLSVSQQHSPHWGHYYSSVGVCRSGGHFSMEPKENDGRNPVGELQEMTQKRLWPPPVYEFTNEIGPAHAREFVCNVRLFNICEQGTWFLFLISSLSILLDI